jgi:multidrug efflux pump subunit AcrA (membrane-fusion protein)
VASAQVNANNAQTSLTDTEAINAQSVAVNQAAATAAQALVNADQATTPPSPNLAADQAALAAANNALATAKAKAKAQQSNDQASALLASAQQQLAGAKSSLAALQTGTPASTLQMDEAQIAIAQVNVNTAQHTLDGATIKSPIAGIVSQVNIAAGQSVSGGGAGTGTSTSYAIVVYTPGSYDVTGTVSDAQVNLVALGQTVEVTPAGSTQALQGKVTAISPAATVTSGVATFGVTAQLTDTSKSIKPGTSATATIVTNQVVHVLTVPTSAVHTTASGSMVQILVNGKPKTVAVTTGASDPTRIQILSGLQLNQTVVIAVITSSVPSSGAGTALGAGGTRGGGGTRGPAAGG